MKWILTKFAKSAPFYSTSGRVMGYELNWAALLLKRWYEW